MLVQCMDESQYANRLEIWENIYNTKMNLKYSYTKSNNQNSDFLQPFFFYHALKSYERSISAPKYGLIL